MSFLVDRVISKLGKYKIDHSRANRKIYYDPKKDCFIQQEEEVEEDSDGDFYSCKSKEDEKEDTLEDLYKLTPARRRD